MKKEQNANFNAFWKVVILVVIVIAFSYFVSDLQATNLAYHNFISIGMENSKEMSVHPNFSYSESEKYLIIPPDWVCREVNCTDCYIDCMCWDLNVIGLGRNIWFNAPKAWCDYYPTPEKRCQK